MHGWRQTYHGSEIILDAPVVLQGDVAQLEACFGPFGDSMYSAPDGARKSFWTHPMELLCDVGHVESHSVRLEMVLVCKIGARFALNVP